MTTEPDLSFLATPEWNAYIRQAELNDRGYYITPLYGSPEWYAAMAGSTPPRDTSTSPRDTSGDASARAIIEETLALYGLSSLGDWAWRKWLDGQPVEQILLEMRQTPEYKARFPAMEFLAKQGRALSEAEYINYERGAISIMRAAGLPEGFYDAPEDFADFLRAGVALPELQERVNLARLAVFNSPPDVLAQLEEFYDIGGRTANLVGELTAYFLDEQRALPIIQQQWLSSQIGSIAKRSGYGAVTRSEAEYLAQLGISPDEAAQGFGNLAKMQELFQNLPGELPEAPTREQGQQAMFAGSATAQQALERQARLRRSLFQATGGYQTVSGGITGLQ